MTEAQARQLIQDNAGARDKAWTLKPALAERQIKNLDEARQHKKKINELYVSATNGDKAAMHKLSWLCHKMCDMSIDLIQQNIELL